MTSGAQQALRRTMEIYSNTTRFALACNTSNKIIEPIQSRCAIVRYSRIPDQEMLSRLLTVCEKEQVREHDAAPNCLLLVCVRSLLRTHDSTFETHRARMISTNVESGM